MRRIETLKRSAYVFAIGRFADPPAIEDLASLALDDEELSEVRGCRPGSCTAVIRGEPGAFNYLVYLNRSDVDMLGGVFGGLVRWFMQRRLKAEAATVLQGLRRRLESGAPPVEATVSP